MGEKNVTREADSPLTHTCHGDTVFCLACRRETRAADFALLQAAYDKAGLEYRRTVKTLPAPSADMAAEE